MSAPLPRLVLLPGMDGTGELFAPLLRELPLDVPASVVSYPDRPANYSEHVALARRELPRDRPFVILGESFSGPVAVMLAAAAPANLVGIILCASFLTCPNRALRALRPLTRFASPKLVPGFLAVHSLLGRFATPALRASHERALAHVGSPALTARLRAMADVDVRDAMRALDLPALYLRGTGDRLVGPRFADEFLASARRGRAIDIDAPHFLLQARPHEAATAIQSFLVGLSSPKTGAFSVPGLPRHTP